MLKLHQILKNYDLMYLITGRVIQIVISLVSIRILTTLLEPKEVGNYYLILSLCFFFSFILLNPLATYVSRNIVEWETQNIVITGYFFFVVIVISLSALSIYIATNFYNYMNYYEKFDYLNFAVVLGGVCIISCIHRNTLTIINILHEKKMFVVFLTSSLALALIFSVAFTLLVAPSAIHWFYGLICAELFMLPLILRYFWSFHNEQAKFWVMDHVFSAPKVLKFCTPIFVSNIFLWSQLYLYRIIVDNRYGLEILAVLGVSIAITSAVFVSIESLVSQYHYPKFLKNIRGKPNKARGDAWNNLAAQAIPVYVFTALFLLAVGKSLLQLLTDEIFHSAYMLTLIAVFAEFFRVVANLLNYALQSEYKTKLSIMPYFCGVVLSTSSLLIYDHSEYPDGIVWILSLANLVTLCRKCHDEVDRNNILIDGYHDTIKGKKLKVKIKK